ncbi:MULTISPECIES: hypothetical protein [unclassified Pseudomonas]|uniref:hypothetical protein n=1 Tax=unclassified Pseudomonas TaxID=196821 RepID=UPI00244BD53D|nr:hypothetical protein [Pseudomonas sp. GD03944]MDH1265217.1 hypothetical protein [Pseudomonas sp. GD03944]
MRISLDPEEAIDRQTPVKENVRLQAQQWRLERIGFFVLLLLIILCLLGLFSGGPLSQVQQRTASGDLQVDYQRFLRNGATTTLVVTVRSRDGGEAGVQFEGELLDSGRIESVVPEPLGSASHAHSGVALRFEPDAEGVARVHVSFRSDAVGLYRFRVVANGEALDLQHFIYP